MQAVAGQCGGRDVKSALDDVSHTLRQRVPTASEVASEHLAQLGSRDMGDVLVAQVRHSRDRAFLDSPHDFVLFVKRDDGDLVSHLLVFALEQGSVVLEFFKQECRFDYFHVFPDVLLGFNILVNTVQHSENVILLDIPYITLCESFQA